MKPMLLLLLFAAGWGTLCAQPRIRTQKLSGGKNTEFILEGNEYPGTTTVFITFKDIYNTTTPPGTSKYEVTSDNTRLMTLRADDESYGVGYSYSWYYIHNCVDPKVDTAFVYRIPCSTCKPVRALRAVYAVDKYFKPDNEHQEIGYMFPLQKGDTVYAMRRGIVTRIDEPKASEIARSEVSFTTQSTNITVEQPDGSNAWYICVDPENLLVKEGDRVWPSTPLALAGSYDGEHYKVSVQLYWYTTQRALKPNDKEFFKLRHCIMRFATTDGVLCPQMGTLCTPVLTDEMLTKEMNKKELKKFLDNKK